MRERKITLLEAYQSMQCYLEKIYKRTSSDDIAALLGDLEILDDQRSSDPAAMDDWIKCVNSILKENE